MLSDIYKEEIVNEIERLDYDNQKRVLDFAKALAATGKRGIPGKLLLSFMRAISPEDLAHMQKEITEHCEQERGMAVSKICRN